MTYIELLKTLSLLTLLTQGSSSSCDESYIIEIPTNINISQEDYIKIKIIENNLRNNQKIHISFEPVIPLHDSHGKKDKFLRITSEDILILPSDTGTKSIAYEFDELSAGEWSGKTTIKIKLESESQSYLLINGESLDRILTSLNPTTITFTNSIINANSLYDVSDAQDESVLLYMDGTNCIISSNSENNIIANSNMAYAFSNISNLSSITFNNIDFSSCTNMSHLFESSGKLATITNINNLDTSKVKDMSYMFYACKYLKNTFDLSGINTSSVINFSNMFYNTKIVTLTGLDNWNTSNVKNMSYMFSSMSALTSCPNISNWDVSNVETMSNMFTGCSKINGNIDVTNWHTSSLKDTSFMFNSLRALKTITGLDNIDVSHVENMESMFANLAVATSIGNLSSWNVSNVTNMKGLFQNSIKLTSIGDISSWNTANVKNMDSLFYNFRVSNIGDISKWNVSNVETFASMFYNYIYLDLSTISSFNNWNVSSNCKDISQMFFLMPWLDNQEVDLSNWNVSGVTNMNKVFYSKDAKLKKLNLTNWNTSNVRSMANMFEGCGHLTDIVGISNFRFNNCDDLSYMFYKCASLTALDLANWNLSTIKNMSHTFAWTYSLTTLGDISNWNLSNCNLDGIFAEGAYIGENNIYPELTN